MHLKILLPYAVFADQGDVVRVVAATHEGSFGILPHRSDCAAALAPGILLYATAAGGETYVAVDEGVLVKAGLDVTVSVRRALGGTDLSQLRAAVEQEFLAQDATAHGEQLAMEKIEAGFMHRLTEFQHG
ncbi:MAG: F0F1 ATP synthase subunit epsilon [Rhodoferax sp.]|nr:F0F1 ATP synthase subunit epsilon [Rhodoferax sp.]